MTLNHQR